MPSDLLRSFRADLWYAHNGDSTLRLDYDLNVDSIVFDLGGYEGNWTDDISRMFSCNVHVFEPVARFADNIKRRFADNPKVKVYKFGLGGQTRKCLLTVLADGSSVFREGGESEEIQLIEAVEFFEKNGITEIDLMKINIEGSEYELLEHLIQTGFVSRIGDIQIQFHDVVPRALERMERIQQALRSTHYVTYQYEFVWENWRKRIIPDTMGECQRVTRQLYAQIDNLAKEVLLYQRGLVSAKLDIKNLKDSLEAAQEQLKETRNALGIVQLESSGFKSCFFKACRILNKGLQRWTNPK